MPSEPEQAVDFDGWVRAREAGLQRFAFLLTGDRSEAADLVQDALIGAWPRWQRLVARGAVDAYLRRSIVNANISRWRKHRRTVVVADPYDVAGESVPAAHSDDADQAWALCAELSPVQRAAVVLRFYEDLPFAQIATILHCSEATARSHVHRALRALRTRLGETTDD